MSHKTDKLHQTKPQRASSSQAQLFLILYPSDPYIQNKCSGKGI